MRWTRLIAAGLFAAALALTQSSPAPQFGGSISGHLLDPAGQPLANWQVQAGRWEYHQGRKELHALPNSTATTSQTGEFTFAALPSGGYCIRATGAAFPTTYYPGVADISAAAQVTVSTGRQTSGVDFRVSSEKTFHVRGRVTGAPGGMITMSPRPMLDPESSQSIFTRPDGSFDIDKVLPGDYTISGYYQYVTSYTVVSVKDSDADNVVVEMLPCAKVRGTVRVDGRPSTAPVTLSALGVAMSWGVDVDKNGTLTSQCVPPANTRFRLNLQTTAIFNPFVSMERT
ncbi:MAG TPA: carboxypeptidase-like regulatory domain-containing protein [Bryobacteraceae bacterium]|jgi:hypothetical protein